MRLFLLSYIYLLVIHEYYLKHDLFYFSGYQNVLVLNICENKVNKSHLTPWGFSYSEQIILFYS